MMKTRNLYLNKIIIYIMSFDIYLKFIIDQTKTEIYNNDTLLNTINSNGLVAVGLNFEFKKSTTNSTKGYIQLSLPCYTTTSKSFEFKYSNSSTYTQRKSIGESFYKHIRSLKTDYIALFINDFDNNVIENNLILNVLSMFNVSKLTKTTSTGMWFLLVKTEGKKIPKTLIEKNSSTDISGYYLTHSQFSQINKDTWNSLFCDVSTTTYIKNTYQTAFDDMDELIYDNESNYAVILSRIHHNVIHEYRNNAPSHITIHDIFIEVPYYSQESNMSSLSADKNVLRNDIKSLKNLVRQYGLTSMIARLEKLDRKTYKDEGFLHKDMINDMLEIRNHYIKIRSDFKTKLNF